MKSILICVFLIAFDLSPIVAIATPSNDLNICNSSAPAKDRECLIAFRRSNQQKAAASQPWSKQADDAAFERLQKINSEEARLNDAGHREDVAEADTDASTWPIECWNGMCYTHHVRLGSVNTLGSSSGSGAVR